MYKYAIRAAIAALAVAPVAAHAFVFWTVPNGTRPGFDYKNGGSDNGFFGDPTWGAAGFAVTPTNFKAESLNGQGTVSMFDKLEVELYAHKGVYFKKFIVEEFGNWSITRNGEVSVSGGLNLLNHDTLENVSDSFSTTPGMPIVRNVTDSGNWKAIAEIDLLSVSNTKWTSLTFQLKNILDATTLENGTKAFIEKENAAIRITVETVPEPATMLAMAAGIGGLLARRRKKS